MPMTPIPDETNTEPDPTFARSGKTPRTPPGAQPARKEQTTKRTLSSPEDCTQTRERKTRRMSNSSSDTNESINQSDLRPDFSDKRGNFIRGCNAIVELKQLAVNAKKSIKTFTLKKCDKLHDIVEELEEVLNIMQEEIIRNDSERESKKILRKLTELENYIKAPKQESYAQITARQQSPRTVQGGNQTMGKTKTLLIYPKEETQQTSEETKTVILGRVNPRRQNLKVHRISRIRNGGVAIEVDNEAQAQTIRNSLKDTVNIKETVKKAPKAILFNIPKEYNEDELIQDLINQNLQENEDLKVEDIKVCFKLGARDANQYNLVLELPPTIHAKLISKRRIFLGWNSTGIANFISVTRCFRCQKYGHISKACNAPVEICGHCAGQGHDRRNCPLTRLDPACANCPKNKNKHSVHSKECPIYIREKQRNIANTAYE